MKFFFKLTALALMLLGLPLLGVWMAGLPIERYLQFPPEAIYVQHAAFSWPAFFAYLAFILLVTVPLLTTGLRAWRQLGSQRLRKPVGGLPWWGWLGAASGIVFWVLAWTRFNWFASLQAHTFTPLWLSYILVINALKFRACGRCMLTDRPGYLLLLFPTSALFWWFFEYLNRFVQNWQYQGTSFGPGEYLLYATISFSTVLPAVLGTRDLLLESRWIEAGFHSYHRLKFRHPRLLATGALLAASAGLTGIGIWPDRLFPLLWVSPLLILVSQQAVLGEEHILDPIGRGDWRMVTACAGAALICGFFWEMWNFYSLAQWVYHIPFVDRFKVFEMPILGYAGYLPFGLQCAVIGAMVDTVTAR
ncbi:MAG: hypothetical protein AMJ54_13710 [Deltaproteobacteria bacterium SG8_13]|nr:MAG: hypothetical protein AMJ54_13710 [Deltaproteobacteria bacterium SG8_13]